MRRTAPLIVGGGPAGAAAAISLARAGARPLLIERSRAGGPIVCGAFLGWDTLASLDRLGLDPWSLGAHPIERVRIVTPGRTIERRLPRRAAGLSRQALDAALLDLASKAGAGIERGIAARSLDGDGLHLADGALLAPESLFIGTGKHALRGTPRIGVAPGARIGLRTAFPAAPRLQGVIELHLLDGGYAGLLVQEDGQANLCLSIAGARLAEADGSPDRLIALLAQEAPLLAERIDGQAGDWSAIAAVPYGWRARDTLPGRFRLGDQAAVIASLAGDGIAIALASGRAAAAAWSSGGAGAAPAYQRAFARRVARPIGIAERLRHAAERPRSAATAMRLMGLPGAIGLAARLTRVGH